MDLGDVFQTVTLTACHRILPDQVPLKGAICGGLAVAGHVAGDLAQPALARTVGSTLVSISQRGQALAAADGATKDTAAANEPPASETSQEGLSDVLAEIGSGWVGQELAKAPCDSAAAALPPPLSTAASLACETVASYAAGKVLPGIAAAYLERFHPPLRA